MNKYREFMNKCNELMNKHHEFIMVVLDLITLSLSIFCVFILLSKRC
jgi:hypothetical protein